MSLSGKEDILPLEFFSRPAEEVALALLGKFLVRRVGRRVIAAMIEEVEIYAGPRDRASHAARGRTKRNEPMFKTGGRWYVYLVYGLHELLNIVTGPADYPAAVLIRGVAGARGPGRVSRLFGISRVSHNDQPATRASGLYIVDRGFQPPQRQIKKLSRVGVAYAGPYWSRRRWRFVLITSAKYPGAKPAP